MVVLFISELLFQTKCCCVCWFCMLIWQTLKCKWMLMSREVQIRRRSSCPCPSDVYRACTCVLESQKHFHLGWTWTEMCPRPRHPSPNLLVWFDGSHFKCIWCIYILGTEHMLMPEVKGSLFDILKPTGSKEQQPYPFLNSNKCFMC